jgi:serine/threonine protein kinase
LPFWGVYYLDEDSKRIGLVSPWLSLGNVTNFLKTIPGADRYALVTFNPLSHADISLMIGIK